MVKKFEFDDELSTENEEVNHQNNEIKEELNEVVADFEDFSANEDNQVAKKKKFIWKWWHYVIVSAVVLMIAFVVYIFIKSNNNGPVYGNRLDGLLSIEESVLQKTETSIKDEYKEIELIDMNVEGKKVKINITFKKGTSTKTVKSISEDALKTLDQNAGNEKGEKDKYSHLFGVYKNVTQYEANFYLVVEENKDFPAFATKHVQNNEITYTFASIADKDSHDKAQSTLED